MVRGAHIHEVIEKIYEEFNGRCVPFFNIYRRIKKTKHNVSEALVRIALEIMSKEEKAQKIKLYNFYTVYCIGKNPQIGVIFDYKKAEECINKLMPSFTFVQLAECVLDHRPTGVPTPIYVGILYVLMRMVKEQKIYSFTVLLDARDRLKIIIQK